MDWNKGKSSMEQLHAHIIRLMLPLRKLLLFMRRKRIEKQRGERERDFN